MLYGTTNYARTINLDELTDITVSAREANDRERYVSVSLYKEDDIRGRIHGDEVVLTMSKRTAANLAKEIKKMVKACNK